MKQSFHIIYYFSWKATNLSFTAHFFDLFLWLFKKILHNMLCKEKHYYFQLLSMHNLHIQSNEKLYFLSPIKFIAVKPNILNLFHLITCISFCSWKYILIAYLLNLQGLFLQLRKEDFLIILITIYLKKKST